MSKQMHRTTFPAGTYYIGDPCYAIEDTDWMDYLDTYPKHSNPHIGWEDGFVVYKGYGCWQAGTAFGDGEYKDKQRRKYPVDAGLIGIIPVILCTQELLDNPSDYGLVKTFTKPFDVWVTDGGTFHFDNITIPTG